jgi:hypothetical protein
VKFAQSLSRFIVPALMGAAAPLSVVAADPAPSDSTGSSLVAVVVQVPVPAGLDRPKLLAAIAQAVPFYRTVPGLVRKYFVVSDDGKFGGIYLWESRAKAESWYADSVIWHSGVSRRSGARAQIDFFRVRSMGAGPGPSGGPAADCVATVVRISAAPGADGAQGGDGIAFSSVPQGVPGLIWTYLTTSDDGRIGAIYLWDSRKSAEAYHNAYWSARMERIYGSPAELTYFSAPVVLDNRP